MVEIPRIKVGERQNIETLINEEALLFAKYLRDEISAWNPRICDFNMKTDFVMPLSKKDVTCRGVLS